MFKKMKMSIKRILAPTDFSEVSNKAIDVAVAIATKGDAEIVAAGDDHARERLDVGRAAVGVDVAAVRVVLDKLEVDWKAAENVVDRAGRGAVGAVDHDLQPADPVL